jgi:type IV secretory pathway VirB4 component
MGDEANTHAIKLSFLKELQHLFQKDASELIDIYLHDAKRKIANLYKALEEANLANFSAAARELRQRSVDVGAIQFSHYCVALEIAAQELRLECLPKLTKALENQFEIIRLALEGLKQLKLNKRELVY